MADPNNELTPPPGERPSLINLAETAKLMAADGAQPTADALTPPEAQAAATRPRGAQSGKKKSGAQRRKEARERAGGAPAVESDAVDGPTPGEMAAQLNALTFGLMIVIAGEHAEPSPNEIKGCNGALTAYLAEHPDFKVRPELLLAGAYLPYVARSLAPKLPTLRDKLAYGVGRGWTALRSMFNRKKKEPADEAAA